MKQKFVIIKNIMYISLNHEHGRLARWRRWIACDVSEAMRRKDWRISRAHSPNLSSLHLSHSSFSKPSVASPMSQLILQTYRHFTYVTANFPNLPSLSLRHSSFSNPSVASPMSQLILQPFRCFTYVTAHSPNFPSLHLRHSSFSKPSLALPTSQLILQPFRCFIYITAHSQILFRFSYITGFSLTSPGEPPMTLSQN